MRTLTIVCPGTGMRWEDMAIVLGLDIDKRHNIKKELDDTYLEYKYPDQLYYCLDGPAVPPEKGNVPSSLSQFNSENSDYIEGEFVEQSAFEQARNFVLGTGLENNVEVVHQLVSYIKANIPKSDSGEEEPLQINLVGFSRGGVNTVMIANALNRDKDTSNIPINIFNIDPVSGSLRENREDIKIVPRNVRNYVTTLASEETLIGFEPRDFSNTQFQSEKTNHLFLPVPDDHCMAMMWSRDMVQSFLSGGSQEPHILYSGSKRGEALKEVYKAQYAEGSVLHFINQSETYLRPLSTREKDQASVETYFEYGFKKTSLQGDAASGARFAQDVSGIVNEREVTKNIRHYRQHRFFFNVHHEAQFASAYPNFYQWITGQKDITLTEFKAEYNAMPQYTKAYFNHVFRIKDIEAFTESHLHKLDRKLKKEAHKNPLNYRSNLNDNKEVLQLLQEGQIRRETGDVIEQTVNLLNYQIVKLSKLYAENPSSLLKDQISQLKEFVNLIKSGSTAEEVFEKAERNRAVKKLLNSPLNFVVREAFSLLSDENKLKDNVIKQHFNKLIELKIQIQHLHDKLDDKYQNLKAEGREAKANVLQEKIVQLKLDLEKVDDYLMKMQDKKENEKLHQLNYRDLKTLLKEQEAEFGWEVTNTLRLSKEEKKIVNEPSHVLSIGTTETRKILKKSDELLKKETLLSHINVMADQKTALIEKHIEISNRLRNKIENAVQKLTDKFNALGDDQPEKKAILKSRIDKLNARSEEIESHIKDVRANEEQIRFSDPFELKQSFQEKDFSLKNSVREDLKLTEKERMIIDTSSNSSGYSSLYSLLVTTGTAKVLQEAEKSLKELPPAPEIRSMQR